MEDNKELEVVSGDGTNLDISPVYEHINQGVPKNKKPTNIIMPKESKKLDEDENEDEKDDEQDDDKKD